MRAVEVIVLLAVIGLLVFAAGTLLRRARERRAPWRLIEDADGEDVTFYACRPGQQRRLLGSAPIAGGDVDGLRGRAEREIAGLNAGRRV
jgi:hypothetical protein